jgi:tetratricopeptide (TPR) repeat protein
MAEKSLNDLPRDLRMMHTRGSDALSRDNFDYAIDLFMQILAREPALFDVRKALRTAQFKKAGAKSGFFRKVLSSASTSPLIAKGQIALHTDPREALHVAEQILNHDPNNSVAHRMIVDVAKNMELPRTAVMSLDILFRNSPKDKNLAIEYGQALAAIGEVSRAERVLADMYRTNPTDNDLAQALKDLSARKTLDEGGYEALADGSGSYRDILKDKDEAASLEQQNRQVRPEDTATRLIKEYEARLKTEPNNLKLLRSLAELYTQKKEFDKALGYYDRLKQADIGNDPSLDKGIAETKVRQFEHQVEQLDPNADDHAERTAQLQADKQAFQIAECQKRVERFPTDLGIRFEMGTLYFQAGKIGEAIQEFQKAQNNPHKRIASMSSLAQCFAKRRMYDLAAKTLQNAIKEKPAFDEEKKELTYHLGCVLESMGKAEDAIDQFKLIYEVDIGYKDVAAKVDAYYSGQE